jgi:TolB-like protein
MAPEQAAAEEAMDQRADVYAVGAMAYELLTGRPPFSGGSAQQILAAQVTKTPQPVRELRPSVPEALSELVMRCLEKEPENRWQRAEEMLPHLEGAGASRGNGLIESVGEGTDVVGGSQRVRIAGMSLVLLLVAMGLWAVTNNAPMSWDVASDARVSPAGGSNTVSEADLPRIVVLPFENRSGWEEDDLVCSMLAEWIARTMDQTKALDIVHPTVLKNLFRGRDEPFSGMVMEVARETGARYALSGSVRRFETSIQFEAQLLDAGSGALLQAFEPVSGPADSVEAVLARASEAFATGCVYALGPGKEKWLFDYYNPPPNLEAYEAYKSAVDAYCEVRVGTAVKALYRAHSLAPSWPCPLIDLLTGLGQLGRHQERDSVLELLQPMLPKLTPMERHKVDWQTASTGYERFRAADKMFQQDPGSWGFAMAVAARDINRLHRAKEGLLGLDLDDPCNRTAPPIWIVGAQVFHLLGEDVAALRWAQDGRARFPGNPRLIIWEARIQAALGAVARVRALADTLRALPVSNATVVAGLVEMGLELELQDKPVASLAFLEEALAWVDEQPDVSPFQKGRLLYYLERYGEALPLLQEAARERPAPESLGYLALCLDGLGYDARADSVMAEIGASPPSRYPALLAARRGNVRKAVDLLRSNFEAGMAYYCPGHGLASQVCLDLDPELQPIRDRPLFQAMMRPTG